MEYNTQRLLNLANKRFSDILRDGFRLFIRSYGTIILVVKSTTKVAIAKGIIDNSQIINPFAQLSLNNP